MQGAKLDAAYKYCLQIARRHYENFPVASLFLPKPQRLALAAIYAFARQADDYADEPLESLLGPGLREYHGKSEREIRLALLKQWEGYLEEAQENPVFVALHDSMERFELPKKLFSDLLKAFRQDVVVRRYQSFEDVLAYCRHSANPVGRLMLHLFGRDDEVSLRQSDCICTALQLTNFWQDLGLDLRQKDRLYLPLQDCRKFGVAVDGLLAGEFSQALAELIAFEMARTRQLFEKGRSLAEKQSGFLRWQLRMTVHGGETILRKIERQGFNTLQRRPKLGKLNLPGLLWKSLFKIGNAHAS